MCVSLLRGCASLSFIGHLFLQCTKTVVIRIYISLYDSGWQKKCAKPINCAETFGKGCKKQLMNTVCEDYTVYDKYYSVNKCCAMKKAKSYETVILL